MFINALQKHTDLENKMPTHNRILLGTKNAISVDQFVNFLKIDFHAQISASTPGKVQKVIISGIVVSNGKIGKFERGYRPDYIESNIKNNNAIDYIELHTDMNELAALIQRDLIGSLINTFDPLFSDASFVSWWNHNQADNEVIKPEDVQVEDKAVITATAFVGTLVHVFMLNTLQAYYKDFLASIQKSNSLKNSLCDCN